MSRPPLKALEQIKKYCEKTQCRRCVYGETYNNMDDLDFVGCSLQAVTPCDWHVPQKSEDYE